MCRRFMLFFMVIQLGLGTSSVEAEETLRIHVLVRWLNHDDLRKFCGMHSRACTTFIGKRLEGSCFAHSGAWRINSSASLVAVMTLPKARTAHDLEERTHEDFHVLDIREAVGDHLEDLRSREFSTEVDCRRASVEATNSFPDRVSAFARSSLAKRK